MVTGAVLIVASEQAFAHSQMIPFPNQVFAAEVLYPSSIALLGLGICFLLWGAVCELRSPRNAGVSSLAAMNEQSRESSK